MVRYGFPVALFLNGALGNVLSWDQLLRDTPPRKGEPGLHDLQGSDLVEYERDIQRIGLSVADEAMRVVERSEFGDEPHLDAASERLQLPFREVTDAETSGPQGSLVEDVIKEKEVESTQQAEIQVLSIGDLALVGMPCELFVEFGLEIKQQVHPRRAVIVGMANGMVGYVPTEEAFRRGGYETTLTTVSKLAPEAGGLMADAAVRLIQETAVESATGPR
jgi:hypothetical protein